MRVGTAPLTLDDCRSHSGIFECTAQGVGAGADAGFGQAHSPQASTATRQTYRTPPCRPSCNRPRCSRQGGPHDSQDHFGPLHRSSMLIHSGCDQPPTHRSPGLPSSPCGNRACESTASRVSRNRIRPPGVRRTRHAFCRAPALGTHTRTPPGCSRGSPAP